MKKILSLMMALCLLILPMSVVADATTLIEHTVSQTYTVSIPEYIEATAQDETEVRYTVTAQDILIPYDYALCVSIIFDSQLAHINDNSITLDYEMYNDYDGVANAFESEENILVVNAGDVSGDSTEIYAKLTSDVNYAGVYTDTVTFTSKVKDASYTYYTLEEIEADATLYAIGKTKSEYVVADFNDDFTEVIITANGEASDGIMANYNKYTTSMSVHSSTVEKATIKKGVTQIGNYAFYECKILSEVVLPSTLTHIWSYAFEGCISLEQIDLPETLTFLGSYVFSNCSALKSIAIPDACNSPLEYCFINCTSLEDVRLSKTMYTIEYSAFMGCTSLKSIYIPPNVTGYRLNPFIDSGLTTIYGVANSKAQTFAKNKGYTFIAVEPETI